MGRARNQRSKAEGSFLESVQEALQRLQEDLCYIKATVAELKHAPEARQQDKQHMINVGESPATGWDDWDAWNNLGFFDDDPVNVEQYGTFWNTNADTFVPITAAGNDVFSKAGLLSLRGPLSPDVPDEIAGLSARKIGDDSPPCDGSSLGRDTSLEEAACQGERGANQGGRSENEDFTFTKEQVRHLLDQNNHHIRLHLEEKAEQTYRGKLKDQEVCLTNLRNELKKVSKELEEFRMREPARELRQEQFSTLVVGMQVFTKDLRDASRNQTKGTLLNYDASAERWQVKLDDDARPVMIRPRNLQPLDSTS